MTAGQGVEMTVELKTVAAIACVVGVCGFAFAEPLWQLGVTDGSDAEFGLRNVCGEYSFQNETGLCVRRSADVDHGTKTFRYAVPGSGTIEKVPLPRELSSPCFERWLDEDQLVTGLELSWNEREPGPRILKVNVAGFSNLDGFGRRGIEFDLPDGGFYAFTLPTGEKNPPEKCFTIDVPLAVRSGRNVVTIRNVAPVLYHRLVFDSIVLEKLDSPVCLPRVLQLKTDAFSNITHLGKSIALGILSRNVAEGTVAWCVQDVWSNVVSRGTAVLSDGRARVALPVERRGWFTVTCTCEGATDETAYVVIEPPEDRMIPDSRFGCHAFVCDRYRLMNTPFFRAYVEKKMRRAYLGGAKKARYHWLSWMLREPEQGRYVFEDLDRYLALGEKHFMTPFLDVTQVPQWNSAAPERTNLVWGAPEFSYHPPRDQKPWGDFVTALAERYKGRVREYEIGNEPSYGSIFWHTGDPVAFGQYLMTAYRAIHSVDKDAVVYPGAPMQVAFMEQLCASLKDEKCFDKLSIHYLDNENRLSTKTENWRRFAQAHGYPSEIVNSEDMNWVVRRRKEPRLGVAADLVKIYVRDAVRGVSCTYGFEMFASLGWLYPFFGADDVPRSEYAVYRAMTHRLEHAKYVGDLSTRLAEAYVFDRAGTPVVVCWSDANQTKEISVTLGKGPFGLVDPMDNETVLKADATGTVRVPVTDNAVFVEGGDWQTIRASLATHTDPLAVAESNPLGENLVPEKARGPILGKRGYWNNVTGNGVQVGYGERYLLSATIRGDGTLHGYYEVRDKAGKRVFPKQDGLNCLEARPETNRWTTVSQVVTIREPDSYRMVVQLVPNFCKEYADSRIEIRDVVVARLDDAVGPTKALRRGERAVAEGPDGRKVSAAVRFEGEEVVFGFELEGDVRATEPIRFALDPYNASKDATVCEVRGEKLFKIRNYVTPELPTGLCGPGIVPGSRVIRNQRQDGTETVHVRLPVRQLYPLRAGQEEIAFDFRVGKTTWSEGIRASVEPSFFGVLKAYGRDRQLRNLEREASDAWRFVTERLVYKPNKLLYDRLCAPGEPDELIKYLPTPEEIRRGYPNACSWDTGMENGVLDGTPLLLAALLRWELTGERSAAKTARETWEGLVSLGEISGVPGFVARSISPHDGKSFYVNSSRDQYTLYAYAMWRYASSKLATPDEKAKCVKLMTEVARYVEACVKPENDYSILRADGKVGLVCKMWTATPAQPANTNRFTHFGGIAPHEVLRLPMIYAAAWALTKDSHWREMELKYLPDGIKMALYPLPDGMDGFCVFQMQISQRLLWEVEPAGATKDALLKTLEHGAALAESNELRVDGFFARPGDFCAAVGDWRQYPMRNCGAPGYEKPQLPMRPAEAWSRQSAENFINEMLCPGRKPTARAAEAVAKAMRRVDYFHTCEAVPVYLILAYWMDRAAATGLRMIP